MAVSEPFSFSIDTRMLDGVPPATDLVGAEAVLTLVDGHGDPMRIAGLVTRVTRKPRVGDAAIGEDAAELRIVLEPVMKRLWVGRDSRVFQDLSVVDLVKKVLDDRGIDAATTE